MHAVIEDDLPHLLPAHNAEVVIISVLTDDVCWGRLHSRAGFHPTV